MTLKLLIQIRARVNTFSVDVSSVSKTWYFLFKLIYSDLEPRHCGISRHTLGTTRMWPKRKSLVTRVFLAKLRGTCWVSRSSCSCERTPSRGWRKVQHSRFSLPGAIPGFSAWGLSGEARGKVRQMHARRLRRWAMRRHLENVKKYANFKTESRKRCTTQVTKTPLFLSGGSLSDQHKPRYDEICLKETIL